MVKKESFSRADLSTTIVLSGRVCAGKTSLASALEAFGFECLSTRSLLLTLASRGADRNRSDLRRVGERLDSELGGRWVADAVAGIARSMQPVVVDAIRTIEQRAVVSTLSGRACHDGRWSVNLSAGDASEMVVIRAIAANAWVVASERCLLNAPGPPWGSWRLRRRCHTRRSHRGGVVYGPQ
jgi:hypothetical protein